MSSISSVEALAFAVPAEERSVEPGVRTDHALLQATLEGDEYAFGELMGRYRNQITNYIYRMTGDFDGAVDLAQETFVRVFRAADRYQANFAFSTYIYRIATNLAISELRKRKRRRLVSLTSFFTRDDEANDAGFDPSDDRPLQDVVLVDFERRQAVSKAITTLPEKYRAPLVLRDVEGKSYDEIASILATNEGTIKSRISRGRTLLKDKLKVYV
jgi:RNA polymerase sigma-70 factor (ECF subfamily)